MNNPLISIITPTLNAEKHVLDTLESIQAQQYDNHEIIIVDGGSTDKTIFIVKDFPKVRIINQTGKGLADAWNNGIENAKGDIISFIDSDDIWENNAILNHLEVLQTDAALTCTVGNLKFFLEKDEECPIGFKKSLLNQKHLGYMPGCFMGKKEIFQRIGIFETRWDIASDIVWFAKLKESTEKIGIVDALVLNKRVHQKNLSYTTSQTPLYQNELLKFLHESIKKKS